MWNKAAWNAWKEADQDAIADKPAAASSSEALGSHLGAKRQRRPSVRLEEIGDRPAAFVAEKRKKKIGFFVASGNFRPKVGDSTATLEVEEPQESDAGNTFRTGKLLKVRPLVHVNNGNFHEHSSSDDDGGDGETHAARHTDLASPCSANPVENWTGHPALHNADEGKTPLQFFKSISKKGRNRNRKRGGPKAAACVKQLSSTAQSTILPNAEGVPCMKDAQGMHSDEENDAHTPEGFRDCDLETSDYLNDDKEMSNSQGSKASRGVDMPLLKGQQEDQPLQVSEDGLSKQGQDFVERNKGVYPSQQVSEEDLPRQDQAFEPRYDVETQILTEASRLPDDNKAKFLLEANENQESRELTSDNAHLHFARHSPPLVNGVRGWLQNLGLGKYAQHFEAHEVDSEVLPLLTFDDLKEMGITAVGSRRKMFYAIQQLGKCLLVKAD